MISWLQVACGTVLTGLLAALFVWLAGRFGRGQWLDVSEWGRPAVVVAVGAVSAGAGSLAWNAILQATTAREFFHDLPVIVFPVSWQDTGSGIFALAAASVALGLVALPSAPARRVSALALLCGFAALLTDTYLY